MRLLTVATLGALNMGVCMCWDPLGWVGEQAGVEIKPQIGSPAPAFDHAQLPPEARYEFGMIWDGVSMGMWSDGSQTGSIHAAAAEAWLAQQDCIPKLEPTDPDEPDRITQICMNHTTFWASVITEGPFSVDHVLLTGPNERMQAAMEQNELAPPADPVP